MAAVGPAVRVHAASDPFLQSTMQQIVDGGFPGAWVVDSAVGTGAAGVADIALNTPTQANMKLRAGSITKSFTGGVVLQLVADNRLGLNDTVQHWLPGLLPYGNQVTVRQLLQHTSGVPDYLESGDTPLLTQFIRKSVPGNPEYDPTFKFRTWTPQQLVGLISGEPRHVLPPNEAEYSDSNYIILGMIIKQVTGNTPQTEVANRFITPLHLNNTSFPVVNPFLNAPFARGYTYNVDTDGSPIVGTRYDITTYNPSFLGATGALVSNPADLNKYMSKLLGGQLLPGWLTAEMKQTVPITLPEGLFPAGFGAGLGIWSWDLSQVADVGCNKTIYGHEGEVPGYDTWAFGNATGTRTISMGVNLMVPDWDAYYAAELPGYASLWCH